MATALTNMKLAEKKLLVVLPETNEVLGKSLRNIEGVKYTTSAQLNPYDLMSHKNVLFANDAFAKIEERLS